MDTTKPRQRATIATDHYRLRLLNLTTQQETFVCFPTLGAQAVWLREQVLGAQMQASLALVEGATCYYCREQKEA